MFHDGLLLEQGDDGGQNVSLQWMVQTSQLELFFPYPIYALPKIALLFIGQVQEWGDGIDLLRRRDIGRKQGIEVFNAILQQNGRIIGTAAEFQHREHGRMNHQCPLRNCTLLVDGQHLRITSYAQFKTYLCFHRQGDSNQVQNNAFFSEKAIIFPKKDAIS